MSRHDVALPETPDHVTGRLGKSESRSGPWKRPQPREGAIADYAQPRQRSQPREGQHERAQATPESEKAPLPQPLRGRRQPRHSLPQKPRPPPTPSLPPNGERGKRSRHESQRGRRPPTSPHDPAPLKEGRKEEEKAKGAQFRRGRDGGRKGRRCSGKDGA